MLPGQKEPICRTNLHICTKARPQKVTQVKKLCSKRRSKRIDRNVQTIFQMFTRQLRPAILRSINMSSARSASTLTPVSTKIEGIGRKPELAKDPEMKNWISRTVYTNYNYFR